MAKKIPAFLKSKPGKKGKKGRQPKIGRAVKGESLQAPYGIGADMKQSPNY